MIDIDQAFVDLPQGTWVWNADHDLDNTNSQQTSVFSGRGIFSESYGPVWMIGTGKLSNLSENIRTTYIRISV